MKKITMLLTVIFSLSFSGLCDASPRNIVKNVGTYITDSFYSDEPRKLSEIQDLFISVGVAKRFNLKFNLSKGKESIISDVTFNIVSTDIQGDSATVKTEILIKGPHPKKNKTRSTLQTYDFILIKNEIGVWQITKFKYKYNGAKPS
jgi:hypothetical protein